MIGNRFTNISTAAFAGNSELTYLVATQTDVDPAAGRLKRRNRVFNLEHCLRCSLTSFKLVPNEQASKRANQQTNKQNDTGERTVAVFTRKKLWLSLRSKKKKREKSQNEVARGETTIGKYSVQQRSHAAIYRFHFEERYVYPMFESGCVICHLLRATDCLSE